MRNIKIWYKGLYSHYDLILQGPAKLYETLHKNYLSRELMLLVNPFQNSFVVTFFKMALKSSRFLKWPVNRKWLGHFALNQRETNQGAI